MSLGLSCVTSLFTLASILLCFFLKGSATPSPSLLALGLTSAISISEPLELFLTSLSSLTNQMTSAQRVQEYCGMAPVSEDPAIAAQLPAAEPLGQGHIPHSLWPTDGAIVFNNVTMRYRQDM